MSITLPPMMSHPECHTYAWTDQEKAAIRARDIEVARVVLEAAAKVLTDHQIPVGNSAAGEMACEWTYAALKECRDAIRAMEISHD